MACGGASCQLELEAEEKGGEGLEEHQPSGVATLYIREDWRGGAASAAPHCVHTRSQLHGGAPANCAGSQLHQSARAQLHGRGFVDCTAAVTGLQGSSGSTGPLDFGGSGPGKEEGGEGTGMTREPSSWGSGAEEATGWRGSPIQQRGIAGEPWLPGSGGVGPAAAGIQWRGRQGVARFGQWRTGGSGGRWLMAEEGRWREVEGGRMEGRAPGSI